jgi:hypothetical protein
MPGTERDIAFSQLAVKGLIEKDFNFAEQSNLTLFFFSEKETCEIVLLTMKKKILHPSQS